MIAINTPLHTMVLSRAHDVFAGTGYGDGPACAGAGGADGEGLGVGAAGADVLVYVAHFYVREGEMDLLRLPILGRIGMRDGLLMRVKEGVRRV
jgi:hypothetical protein